jgi:hypothetical protein
MDLTIDQAGFARALRLIGRAVPSRPTLPVLQHVLLEGTPGRLTLTATDLDLAVVTSTPADVAAPGRVLLPARLLGEFVGQLPAAPVVVQTVRREWTTTGRLSVWARGSFALTEPTGRLRLWLTDALMRGAQRIAPSPPAGPTTAPLRTAA